MSLSLQNKVLMTLSTENNILKLMSLVDISRNITDFAVNACDEFNFFSPNGLAQVSTCCAAIRVLEDKGMIELPSKWAAKSRKWTLKTMDSSIPLPTPPATLSSLEGVINVTRVNTIEDTMIFNTLLKEESEVSFTKLPPMPVCYLVKIPEGVIGAIAFTYANFNNAARESFIGWNTAEKNNFLHYVANLRMFTIRKGYEDLDSYILEQALYKLKRDYYNLYGIRLLLVEASVPISNVNRFSRHAWTLASSSKPLRMAKKEISENIKKKTTSVYIYAYDDDYRDKLAPHLKQVEHNIENYLSNDNWVEKEVNTSSYDRRLLARTQKVIKNKCRYPNQSFLKTCSGIKAEQKGYYRLMETNNSAYNFHSIIQPSIINTGIRCSFYPKILWVSDGSDLNYEHLPHCTGLGKIGTKHQVPGLHLHATLGLTTNELLLGIGHATCSDIIHRDIDEKGCHYYIPLEHKNSFIWYQHVEKIHKLMLKNPVINIFIGDRGADDFGLYQYILSLKNVDFVIRSQYNRNLEGEYYKLHDLIRKIPSMGTTELDIENKHKNGSNKSNRGKYKKVKNKNKNKKNKNKKNKNKKNNDTKQSNFGKKKVKFHVSYKEVTILPPQSHKQNCKPLPITVIRGWEEKPIRGRERKEWILLTSLHVKSVDDAIQCIKYYRSRWRVEEYFRMLKSGCGVEKVFFDSCERILRSIAINLIVAWRLLFVGLLGGKLPPLPADVMFNEEQIHVLRGYAIVNNLKPPNTLDEALHLVGLLGGACTNNSYPKAGYISIKDGLSKLESFKEMEHLSKLGGM